MRIELIGMYTVERAEELAGQFMQALTSREETEVCFSALEEADLSFFQILHAAQRSFADAGLKLVYLNNIPKKLSFQASKTGWEKLLAA